MAGRIRRPGGGRKNLTQTDPALIAALDDLIEGGTRGDPESPLRWICKSTRTLAAELCSQKHPVSYVRVAQLLHNQNYSLQGNRKLEEGEDHPDRDAQFRHINRCVKRALAAGEPVISVDTKKKELIGNYANAGRQWLPAKQPRRVNGHNFPSPEVPRAFPYGIYDLQHNSGFVNVGTSTMLDYDEFSRSFFNRLLVERARLTRCLATSFRACAGPKRGKGRAAWSKSRTLAMDRAGRTSS